MARLAQHAQSQSKRRWGVGLLAGLALLAVPAAAQAGPLGEARSVVREPDRPYTVVAGEADASAVVQNSANLAYLEGFNAVIDFTANVNAAGRRGNGVGAFLAVPLPWDLLALGVGGQVVWREQDTADDEPGCPDCGFGKLSVAAAVPFERWVPGLSAGFTYSRLISSGNLVAANRNQFDLGVSYRANRFVSLAAVGRHLNAARGVVPYLDTELALRPTGTPNFELGLGARLGFVVSRPAERDAPVQPRLRLLVGRGGVRVYGEAELYNDYLGDGVADFRTAARVSVGLQVDTAHVGLAVGPNFAVNSGAATQPLQGASGRLRLSHERYTQVLRTRPRQVTRISLAGKSDDRDLAEVVWTFDGLARRGPGVILLEVDGSDFGLAQLEEVREAVLRYRAQGGKVVAYLEGASTFEYFLAASCDRIYAHPQQGLELRGVLRNTFYFGELLGRLGVRAEFVRIAEYKGTPERASRGEPSAPVARANRAYVTDTWNHVVRLIGHSRARDPAVVSEWIDRAVWTPEDARRMGLIEGLAWPEELDARLEGWLGRAVRIDAPPKAPVREGHWIEPAHVAVLHIDGTIDDGISLHVPILDIDVSGAASLTKTIAALRDDPDVRAIVVRVDSPGGSVKGAQDIAHALDLAREVKPVVISMGNQAASGGYWVATAGQYIYADATTLTGSIGIFYPKFDFSEFLDRYGVGVDSVAIGDRAAMRSMWLANSDADREAAMRGIRASYDRFIVRVAEARAMTPEQADAVARGRVWSGVRALEVGLVDRYGGLYEAVSRAAVMGELADSGDALEIRHYPEDPTLVDQIRRLWNFELDLPLGRAGGALRGQGLAAIDPLSGRALSFADPLLRTLRRIPASLWLSEGPEAMALSDHSIEIEG